MTDGHAIRAEAVANCIAEFRAAASADAHLGASDAVRLSGVGTTAARAVRGSLLHDALAAERLTIGGVSDADEPKVLFDDPDWHLALVLSPWKQQVATQVDAVTHSAKLTEVIDTVVRHGGGSVGVNTNTFAAEAALQALSGGTPPSHIVILGSGGSSNSVAAAVMRLWPDAEIVGAARRPEQLSHWPETYRARVVAAGDLHAALSGLRRLVVVNTTTWGETDESEEQPFGFDLDTMFQLEASLFDLNNRVSELQRIALSAGMPVMSGVYMQRTTNACRAALIKELFR